jgi:hypothetical protein
LARDLGGSDPERMSPPNFVHYLEQVIGAYPHMKMSVISNPHGMRILVFIDLIYL